MKLPDKITSNKPAQTQKKSGKYVIGWVILGFVLLCGYIAQAVIRSEINSIKNDTQSSAADSSWKTYISTQDGFEVDFIGGLPTVENTSIDVQGYSVPYTTYERDNDNTYWILGVYKYPSDFDMSDVNARLEGSLNGAIQNTQGATLVKSEYVQLDGRTAIKAEYTVTQSSQLINVYYLSTLLGNTMYALLGSGGSESDFNTFVNSFHIIH